MNTQTLSIAEHENQKIKENTDSSHYKRNVLIYDTYF